MPPSPTTTAGLASLHWVRREDPRVPLSPDAIRAMADGGDLLGGALISIEGMTPR